MANNGYIILKGEIIQLKTKKNSEDKKKLCMYQGFRSGQQDWIYSWYIKLPIAAIFNGHHIISNSYEYKLHLSMNGAFTVLIYAMWHLVVKGTNSLIRLNLCS